MRLAVLDLGSNSFQLAIFRRGPDGRPQRLERLREMVRLGAGIDRGGRLEPAARDRADAAFGRLARGADAADRVVAVATSALREARDGADWCAEATRRHGIAIEILGGLEEARLGFLGACVGLALPARRAVIEVGGGSAQISAGDTSGVATSTSVPLGVLRLRTLDDDALRTRVATTAGAGLRAMRAAGPRAVVLGGGTARRLARVARALGLAEPQGDELRRDALVQLAATLPTLVRRQLTALGVEEARHDTIRPGALILHTMLEVAEVERAIVSPGGLREGVALRELGAQRWRPGDAAIAAL